MASSWRLSISDWMALRSSVAAPARGAKARAANEFWKNRRRFIFDEYTTGPASTRVLAPRARSVGFCDYRAAVNWVAGDDAFSGAVEFVDQRRVADAGFEGFDAGVGFGIVF